MFIVSASGGQKTQFWANFEFLGAHVPTPLTDEGQILCAIADQRSTLTCQISSGSLYSVALCWRKTPIFAVFWSSAFSVVTNWQQSDKVKHGCTTTNLPLYPTASKLFLYSNAFMAKSGAQTLTFKSVTDRQTNRQKKLNVFGHPGGG